MTVGLERAPPPQAATPPTAPTPAAVATPRSPAADFDVSIASAIADADANRSIGSGASALRVIAARSGGTEVRTSAGSGTGPLRRARATLAALSPSHGRTPVSISYITMPSE